MSLAEHLPQAAGNSGHRSNVEKAMDRLDDDDRAQLDAWLRDANVGYRRIGLALTSATGIKVSEGSVSLYARTNGIQRR